MQQKIKSILQTTTLIMGFSVIFKISKAQVLTYEDSLSAGITRSAQKTFVSSYGQVFASYDLKQGKGTANLQRIVLFLGHKFNKNITFFSEWELEDARVENGRPAGEFSIEQCFLKMNINPDYYFTAGLFIPRIGIINENHLPTTFSTNRRPMVETLILPSTWRDIGIGFYASPRSIPGFNLSLGVVNGLNSQGFEHGTGIREGRFNGQNATATNLAITGAILQYLGNWRVQVSGYFGGSAGLAKRQSDSLRLDRGIFGTPVAVGEANVQYFSKGFYGKALATVVSIPNASEINRAYANNTPELMYGTYIELGYNLLQSFNKPERNLSIFARYEKLDQNAKMSANGIRDTQYNQQYIISGVNYAPIKGIVLKFDYTHRLTGSPNQALLVNPFPTAPQYFTSSGFVNIGIGYSF
jgi:hypothetical protein